MFSSKFPLGQLGQGPRLPINSQQPLVGDCLLGLWGVSSCEDRLWWPQKHLACVRPAPAPITHSFTAGLTVSAHSLEVTCVAVQVLGKPERRESTPKCPPQTETEPGRSLREAAPGKDLRRASRERKQCRRRGRELWRSRGPPGWDRE